MKLTLAAAALIVFAFEQCPKVNADAAANATSSKLVCDNIEAGTDPATLLEGRHITIALYSGELSQLNDTTGEWSGYDIDLMDKLARTGGFTYVTACQTVCIPAPHPNCVVYMSTRADVFNAGALFVAA